VVKYREQRLFVIIICYDKEADFFADADKLLPFCNFGTKRRGVVFWSLKRMWDAANQR
jgi:hypothetical protein